MFVLADVKNDIRNRFSYARNTFDIIENRLKRLGIVGNDFEQIIETARDIKTLRYVGIDLDRVFETFIKLRIFDSDGNERHYVLIELLRIENHGITPDDSARLKLSYPIAYGRRGKIDFIGYIRSVYPRVFPQAFKYSYVGIIHFLLPFISAPIIA